MRGVQDLILLPHIGAAGAKLIFRGLRRDCRQIQDLKSTLLLQVTGKIVLMHALHDEDNACRLFVVRAAEQSGAVPLDGSLPHRFGMGVFLL